MVWILWKRDWAYLKLVVLLFFTLIILLGLYYFADIDLFGTHFISILDSPHYEYFWFLFEYPLGGYLTVLFLVVGLPIFLRRGLFLYFLTLSLSALVFFIYFSDRYVSSKYIIHFTPFIILLACVSLYFIIALFLKNKPIHKAILIFISIFIIGSTFYLNIPWLYEMPKYGRFSEAYEVINENYTEDEVIVGVYLRTYYIHPQGTERENVNVVHMPPRGVDWFTLEELIETIDEYDSGWITWETYTRWHIRPEIAEYCDRNLEKLHGEGIDDTRVEVYYYGERTFTHPRH